MFRVDDISKMDDVSHLSRERMQWQFFDPAPYDGPCCGPRCVQGLTAFTYSCVSWWGDIVVFACSPHCVVDAIELRASQLAVKEIQMNAAYTAIPVGENGSFKVIKPKQESMF